MYVNYLQACVLFVLQLKPACIKIRLSTSQCVKIKDDLASESTQGPPTIKYDDCTLPIM